MKKYLLLFLISVSYYTYSQPGYSFEYKIHPEKKYSLQMDVSSVTESTIDGKTTKSDYLTRVTRITTTEKGDNQGHFPATMKFMNVSSLADGNKTVNPISNTVIKGLMTEDNRFKIDTIINPNINELTKNALKSVFKDVKPDIDFPSKPLRIGDTFEHKVPMTIPANGEQVKIILTKTFTLKNVIKNIALFDVTEKILLNMDSAVITATGEGSGSVAFNTSENQIITDTSHFIITIKVKTNGTDNNTTLVTSDSEKTTTISNNLTLSGEPPKTHKK